MVESTPTSTGLMNDEGIQRLILVTLDSENEIKDSLILAKKIGISHAELDKNLKSLMADDYIQLEVIERKLIELSDEGKSYVERGTPEFQYTNALVINTPTLKKDVEAIVGAEIAKIGFSKAMQRKWIRLSPDNKEQVERITEVLDDSERLQLRSFVEDTDADKHDKKIVDGLKKRKLLNVISQKSYKVTKGTNFQKERKKLETDLTADMIRTGAWRETQFKKYNFQAVGQDVQGGHLHPLLKVRAFFREVLLEMGFNEMPTNRFVESSFWNFDTLFQPQSHPARDMHDTFFLKNPTYCKDFPEEYAKNVKDVHEKGGYGSTGY